MNMLGRETATVYGADTVKNSPHFMDTEYPWARSQESAYSR